jgi:hypothetical protein
MQAQIERVLELQSAYSPRATTEMVERGQLVRNDCANWLQGYATELSNAIGIPLEDLLVEGRDGTGGVGYRLDAAERSAIENQTVKLATAYYKGGGWTVKVRGKPHDPELKKGVRAMTVEVKGTTSEGEVVALTPNEVAHHAAAYPNNARDRTTDRASPR